MAQSDPNLGSLLASAPHPGQGGDSRLVLFTHSCLPYCKDDKAIFPLKTAKALVSLGVAEIVGETTPQDTDKPKAKRGKTNPSQVSPTSDQPAPLPPDLLLGGAASPDAADPSLEGTPDADNP